MKNNEIENLIKNLLEKMGISIERISFDVDKPKRFSDNALWFSVEVNDPRHFSDHGGEALSALNHMVRKIIESSLAKINPTNSQDEQKNNKEGSYTPLLDIMIDINGLQKRKIESIHSVAHMMAERARYFKSNIEIDPMPAFERRIVHEFLSDATDLKTESEGEGKNRRVVIKYIGTI